ncbi:CU044_2847 family protein [Glycomyces tenuis]|uniref:CU044_2847 family protein n=1 Tax=Glycomyces tenuis TaxID=58116 RepID=UPI0003FD21E3|nr:CU044_2847 family protein [Glycomyces tenuis]
MRQTVPVKVGQAEFLVETVADAADEGSLRPISGALDEPESLDRIRDTVEAVSGELVSVWEKVRPQEATVEFGIAVDVKAGKLTGLLVGGGAAATLKVTLKWSSASDGV